MALLTLGLFAFDVTALPFTQLSRRSAWRHPTNDRVGARPASQFAGPGEDVITLSGTHAPVVMGDPKSLTDLREMADSGEAWPLLDGAGQNYGAFVITGLDETQKSHMDNGVARITDFTLTLQRADDVRVDDEASA